MCDPYRKPSCKYELREVRWHRLKKGDIKFVNYKTKQNACSTKKYLQMGCFWRVCWPSGRWQSFSLSTFFVLPSSVLSLFFADDNQTIIRRKDGRQKGAAKANKKQINADARYRSQKKRTADAWKEESRQEEQKEGKQKSQEAEGRGRYWDNIGDRRDKRH